MNIKIYFKEIMEETTMYTSKTLSEVCMLVSGVLLLIMGALSKIPITSLVTCNCSINHVRNAALSTAGTDFITSLMILAGAGLLTVYFMKRIHSDRNA